MEESTELVIKPGRYTTRCGTRAEVYKVMEQNGTYGTVFGATCDDYGWWSLRAWEGPRAGIARAFDLVAEGWPIEKPRFDRSHLPSWCNKAIAKNMDGTWWAFPFPPVIDENECSWRGYDAVQIPHDLRPQWEGVWKDSLVVWEDEA